MSSKQIFETIVYAVVLTVSTLLGWYIVVSSIGFANYSNKQPWLLILLVGCIALQLVIWAEILPKRGFGGSLVEFNAFQFFMLFVAGWFVSYQGAVGNVAVHLSMTAAFLIGITFSLVVGCVLSEAVFSAIIEKPKVKNSDS